MNKKSLMLAAIAGVFGLAGNPVVAQVQVVNVTGGKIEGTVNGVIASFKGIPFAAPPVGENRWKAPQPVKPWSGVKKADAFGPGCIQGTNGMVGLFKGPTNFSEDCLQLNVWTPAKSANEKLPVMVWIYGGGFAEGETSLPVYDGTHLAEKGVILVSISYRTGAFGFLAHPELSKESGGKGSGNYGLLDQIAALQWVRNNIAKFGGDPARVTIFGESAGGISVSMLTASPLAKGLFARAISQSGGSFGPPQIANEAGQWGRMLPAAEAAGKKFLSELGANDIAAARALSAEKIFSAVGPATGRFWPVFDGYVLLGDQYDLYTAGRFNDTPILIGSNSDEGSIFARGNITSAAFEKTVRDGYGDKAEVILAAYPHATDAEAVQSAKNLFRESILAWHTWTWAKLHAQKSRYKTFVYYFDHRTPRAPNGAGHGVEMAFVFGNFPNPLSEPTPEDATLSNLLATYWTNFAKTGDPNSAGLATWPAYTSASPQVMKVDKNPVPQPVPNLKQLQAHDEYFAWRRTQTGGKK